MGILQAQNVHYIYQSKYQKVHAVISITSKWYRSIPAFSKASISRFSAPKSAHIIDGHNSFSIASSFMPPVWPAWHFIDFKNFSFSSGKHGKSVIETFSSLAPASRSPGMLLSC